MTLVFRNVLQNESINGHHKNVKFLCADVTSPNMSNSVSEGSVDVIFSNWLLMYLSDNEVSFVYFREYKFAKFSRFCTQCGPSGVTLFVFLLIP